MVIMIYMLKFSRILICVIYRMFWPISIYRLALRLCRMMMQRTVWLILFVMIWLAVLVRLEIFLTMPGRVMHFLPVFRWLCVNISVIPLLTLSVLCVMVVLNRNYEKLMAFLKLLCHRLNRLGLMFSRFLVSLMVAMLLILLMSQVLVLLNSLLLFSTIVVNFLAGA